MLVDNEAAWLRPMHEGFEEALRANNLEALGDYYMTEAVLLAPSRATIAGRQQICAFWKDTQRIQSLAFDVTQLEKIGGNAIREAGNLIVIVAGRERKTFNTVAKYILLWMRDGDGWKIDCMAWNGTGGGRGRRKRAGNGVGPKAKGNKGVNGGRGGGGKGRPR